MSASEFLLELQRRYAPLQQSLRTVLKEQELLENSLLVQHGFLIRRYTLQTSKIDRKFLAALHERLEQDSTIESDIIYYLDQHNSLLKEMESEYRIYMKKQLKLKEVFVQHMNNAFRLTKMLVVQVERLQRICEQHDDEAAGTLLASIERMLNQVMRFIDLIDGLCKELQKMESELSPIARVYGRAMGKQEAKRTRKQGMLIGGDEKYVPVFDCPQNVIERITNMNADGRKGVFEHIGVRQVNTVLIFRTRVNPVVGPIPQNNGLHEYKLPKGTPIDILFAA